MLSVKDKMRLDFERQWWKYSGAKDAAIREHLGESSTRYYQRLAVLIDRPEALEYDPMLVRRLRRIRDRRRQLRSRRATG